MPSKRQTKVERAKELMRANPYWGRTRINNALRKEFKHGLRNSEVAVIKTSIEASLPLEYQRYKSLLNDGFLKSEARILNQERIGTDAMKEYRYGRRKLIQEARQLGMKPARITHEILLGYRETGYMKKGKKDVLGAFKAFESEGLHYYQMPKPPSAEKRHSALVRTEQGSAEFEDIARKVLDALQDHGWIEEDAYRIVYGSKEYPMTAAALTDMYNSIPFRNMLKRRLSFIEREMARLKQLGVDYDKAINMIKRKIVKTSKDNDIDPFDFLRYEYSDASIRKPKCMTRVSALPRAKPIDRPKQTRWQKAKERQPYAVQRRELRKAEVAAKKVRKLYG